ncbi:MAG TPA: pseudouridine-5'-phosphate glycosidase [bacterium]|jgi:pseudouridine-5'-phosphate glycosidase
MPEWHQVIDLAPGVADAVAAGRPIVLLESAVISHGLPAQLALDTAAELFADAADEGVLAATTAVIDGRIVVGASPQQLGRLTSADTVKIAERDLATAVALGQTGGTTVSATVAIAGIIDVRVVTTGGIGGVHLGAERTWDVSADLAALAAHRVAVVCAGAKAICDIPKTLEFLETAGVTVVGFRTDRFPFFYALDSGCAVPRRIESPHDGAQILAVKRALGQTGGLLIANPIPAHAALDRAQVVEAVERAQREAAPAGATGADLTPFLLARLSAITEGASLGANVALLRSNTRLAARVAQAATG